MAVNQLKLIFQLYIEIEDSKPKIWRRVQVPYEFSFNELHHVIQHSFSWEDSHLHNFTLSERYQENCDFIRFTPQFDNFELNGFNENKYHLKDYIKPGSRFKYHYDFGDDWIHNILVEGLFIKEKRGKYPTCIDGANHAPFEDIGGIYGYMNALEILKDPEHEEYKDLVLWLKEIMGSTKFRKFDPSYFNPKKIKFNKAHGV